MAEEMMFSSRKFNENIQFVLGIDITFCVLCSTWTVFVLLSSRNSIVTLLRLFGRYSDLHRGVKSQTSIVSYFLPKGIGLSKWFLSLVGKGSVLFGGKIFNFEKYFPLRFIAKFKTS